MLLVTLRNYANTEIASVKYVDIPTPYRKKDIEISDFFGEKWIFTNNVSSRNGVAGPRGAPQNSRFGKWVLQIAN